MAPPIRKPRQSSAVAKMTPEQYLEHHPLTKHLKSKYQNSFHLIDAVRTVQTDGNNPSSWPLTSKNEIPRNVPENLVRAYALLKWSIGGNDDDDSALEEISSIVSSAIAAPILERGLKQAKKEQDTRAKQMVDADDSRRKILEVFDRLSKEKPKAQIKTLVAETASECNCHERSVYRARKTRK